MADELWASGEWTVRVERNHGTSAVEIHLNQPFAWIGSLPTTHVQLSDPRVSRTHAYLHRTKNGVYFVDLASRTGLVYRGVPAGAGWLEPGQPLEIAGFHLFVDLELTAGTADLIARVPPADDPRLPVWIHAELGRQNTVFSLDRPLTLIGRDPPCKVRLPRAKLPRVYMAIYREPEAAWAISTGSEPLRRGADVLAACRLTNEGLLDLPFGHLRTFLRQPPGWSIALTGDYAGESALAASESSDSLPAIAASMQIEEQAGLIADLQSQLGILQAEISAVRIALGTAERERDATKEGSSQQTLEIQAAVRQELEAMRSDLEQQLAAVEQQRSELAQRLKESTSALAQARHENEALQQRPGKPEVEALRETATTAAAELARLQQEHAAAVAHCQQACEERDRIRGEHQSVLDRVAWFAEQLDQAKRELAASAKLFADQQRTIERLARELDTAHQQQAQQLEQAQHAQAELTAQLRQTNDERQRRETQVLQLQEETHCLQAALAEANATIERRQSDIAALQQHADAGRQEFDRQRASGDADLATTKARLSSLQGQFDRLASEESQRRQQLKEIQTTAAQLREENRALQELLDEATAALQHQQQRGPGHTAWDGNVTDVAPSGSAVELIPRAQQVGPTEGSGARPKPVPEIVATVSPRTPPDPRTVRRPALTPPPRRLPGDPHLEISERLIDRFTAMETQRRNLRLLIIGAALLVLLGAGGLAWRFRAQLRGSVETVKGILSGAQISAKP